MILRKHPAVFFAFSYHMLKGVYELKQWFLVGLVALFVILKLLIPSHAEIKKQTLAFLGLERETVQALGRSLEASP